ncbi:MAG: hypothetical protein LQ350_004366 [Teloschistes chrysophthalmus]|nr:MAG: hypothetical protein LQ350_004366 [Niorma chrysophthalma]
MDKSHEVDLYNTAPISHPQDKTADERDREDLARLGKKQVLKRNFGFLSMLGFSCTMLVTWEGLLVLFVQGLTNGGPTGLIYGFILAWIGTLAVFLTLAEMASMAPTSSGQYHWVAMLTPMSCRKFLSYLTGWVTVTGWQAFVASVFYLTGTLIQGLIVLEHPDYEPKLWHGTLLFWAIAACAVFVNTVVSRALPALERFILVVHVLGFLAIITPLVYLSPHTSSHDVFGRFLNAGGWSSQGLSFFVGVIGNVFAFLGMNQSSGLPINTAANEMNNFLQAWMELFTILLNSALGFGMLVGVLFCIGNLDDALATPTGYPFMEIFLQGTGSRKGSAAMISVIIILSVCATIAILASSSRLTWSFARDRGLPGWQYLSRVEPRTCLPLVSIATTTTIAILLSLISIGSTVALNDVLSLTIAGLFLSYLACCSLLLYRRLTGGIITPTPAAAPTTTTTSNTSLPPSATYPQYKPLTWGPFHIPSPLGAIVNALACIFLIVITFFSFFPPVTPVKPSTMNYSVLVTGGVVGFAAVYY